MKDRGFTLLEVIIALAILSISLMVIIQTQGQSIRMANYAKNLTTATLLARSKMEDIIYRIEKEGFPEVDEETEGDFEEEGFPKFKWTASIKSVTLPAAEQIVESSEPGKAVATIGDLKLDAGAISQYLGIVSELIGQSIKEIKLTILWQSEGKEQHLDVTTHIVRLEGETVQPIPYTPGAKPKQMDLRGVKPGSKTRMDIAFPKNRMFDSLKMHFPFKR